MGFFSWFIPIVIYGLSKVPRLDYRAQMAILTVVGVILLQFNDVTIFYCRELGSWFRSHEFYFFYYLTTKLDNGAFAILQYLPFGFFGGAFGLLFTNTKDVKHYWVYCGILSGLCIVCGIPNLFGDAATLVQDVFGWIKPKSYLFFMGAIQSIAMMICLQLADNPKRPVEKRYRTIKRTTFLRRINALSLTAYIVEPRYNCSVVLQSALRRRRRPRQGHVSVALVHLPPLYVVVRDAVGDHLPSLGERAFPLQYGASA